MARAVTLVGRGRMGSSLARALSKRVGAVTLVRASTYLKKPRRASPSPSTWVLAVRDGALADASKSLAPVLSRGDVVLHLAGMLGPEVLAPAREAGAAVASLHPLCAVAEGNRDEWQVWGAAFVVEGDPKARAEAKRLVSAIRGTLVEATAVDRARYHGGAALVATGAVALAQGAAALFASSVKPRPSERELRAMTASLLASVSGNVFAVGATKALASPLLRDDTATVARHLDAMADEAATQALYRAAVALVVDTLEAGALVRPETISEARRLVKGRTRGSSSGE